MEKEKVSDWLDNNSEDTGITDFEIENKKSGESNHNYIINTEDSRYVLRVSRKISRESRLENEAEKLDFLEKQGIDRVPRKIWFRKDTELGEVLIESYVGEQELDKESMTDGRLRSLAEKLAEIHSMNVSDYSDYSGVEEPEDKNLQKVFKEDFRDWSKRPYREYLELVEEPDPRITDFFQKQKQLIEQVPDIRVDRSLVHGDLGFNVRATGEDVFIVDWEFSRIDYPDLEIIYCFEHEKLDQDQREVFLKEYRKHRETEKVFEKIRELYRKFLGFNDMIWAAKRVEQGDEKHRELLDEKLDHLEKLYREE